jgi:Reverse transcriptase (RNA-dependent DNA polymerase)
MQLQDALARGYFPKELPSIFSSVPFAMVSSSLSAAVPARMWTSPVNLNLARPGTLRRHLAIPNPFSQRILASTCASNWTDLDSHLRRSGISLTRPVPSPKGRALAFRVPFSSRATERVARAPRARYTLRTDISECYRSVYTHSLEWALHTKASAKANLAARGPALLGGILDKNVREGQDGQTKGIPIGPDTSLLLCEIVLCAVDAELEARHPKTRDFCIRFMDDLEFCAQSKGEAEDVLLTWDSLVSSYDLSVNPMKTEIIEGPVPPVFPWRVTLSQFNLRTSSDAVFVNDLHSIFPCLRTFSTESR